MKKIIEIDNKERDIAHLKNPNNWHAWGLCPVKQLKSSLIGIVLDNGQSTVYLCNMWNVPIDLNTVKKIKYNSFEDMVNDNWRVD